MCNNGFGGGNCCWIIILLIIRNGTRGPRPKTRAAFLGVPIFARLLCGEKNGWFSVSDDKLNIL